MRIHAVTPGLIDTLLIQTAYGAEHDAISRNPSGILPGKGAGTTEEVAQVSLMLMTNAYMTAEVAHVDGAGRFV